MIERFQISADASIAAGAQEVGADRDGHETTCGRIGEVLIVDASAKTDGQMWADGLTKDIGQRKRDNVQRLAGKILNFVVRSEECAVIEHFQRVAEFAAEAAPTRDGKLCHTSAELDRFVELQAGSIGGRIDLQFGVAEHVVEQMLETLFAEHGRIHFHDHIELAIDDQEFADALDLVGGAAVEGRERERVGKMRGVIEFAGDLVARWDAARSSATAWLASRMPSRNDCTFSLLMPARS